MPTGFAEPRPYYAANVYHAWAERDVKDAKELGEKITELLGA